MKKHAISAFADAPAEKIVLVANANAAVGGFDEDVCRKERPRELTDRGNADRDAAESDAIDRNGLRFAEGGIQPLETLSGSQPSTAIGRKPSRE